VQFFRNLRSTIFRLSPWAGNLFLFRSFLGFSFLFVFTFLAQAAGEVFSDTLYLSDNNGLNQMTGLAWAPDGSNRLFAIRKTGQVMIIQNGAVLPTPFVTVSPIFLDDECGLVGFAFDPSFITNGYIYFFVTASSSEQRIVRYTASGNLGTNPTIIKSGLPTKGTYHNGGGLGIGPDGKIYWAIGDNYDGSGVDADLTSLASKIGRANRDGTLPVDNPFIDGAGPNNDYIWARGFRNPFTLTFQPGLGKLWVNGVGTNYEQVFVVNKGSHAGWNDYENNQPAGYLSPVIAYRTNGFDTRNLTATGIVLQNNVVTFTTTTPHGFRTGQHVFPENTPDLPNGLPLVVASVPSATTFTASFDYPLNINSGGGTVRSFYMGGCISGGTFWDSTAAPLDYQGNYFFGDYNSGRMMRVALNGSNQVTDFDSAPSGGELSNCIDTAIGPDGAIYYASVGNGQIRRIAFDYTTQKLIVTPTQMQTDEGGRIAFSVRLATAPVSNVTVSTTHASGDLDLKVQNGANLTFTPSNFATPQAVVLRAMEDTDTSDDEAVFTIASSGLASQTVKLRALDNDPLFIMTSVTLLPVTEGGTAQLTARLAQAPTNTVTVSVTHSSGDADVSVATGNSLVFTPANYATPQPVTIAAAPDADPDSDAAVISLQAPGYTTQTVAVTVKDDEAVQPTFTSTPVTTGVEHTPYSYQAVALGPPAPTFSLDAAPAGMSIDPITGFISWEPLYPSNFAVTVRASNGAAQDALQSFTLTVAYNQPPVATLTHPYNGGIVSGTNVEWSGEGVDDVACTRGEFSIGSSYSTDTNPSQHYHYHGAPLSWDTTQYQNGALTLRFTVFDALGYSNSKTVKVIIANGLTPLEGWRNAHWGTFSPDSSNGNQVDFDHDGLNNLLEYAMGLDPRETDDPARLPSVYFEKVAGQNYVALRYQRPINGRTDVTYIVQVTDNLTSWSSGPSVTTTISTVANGDGTETVSVRDDTPTTGASRRFIRLLISNP
jgi:glucose/arabinose dehydrogenase